MKLFKKKEPRVIKDDDPLLIKLWYNERTHAAIVLGLYLFFFAIIIILFNLTSGGKRNDLLIKGSDISNLFNYDESYVVSYNYVINESNKTYYFSGVNRNDSLYGKMLYNGDSTTIKVNGGECVVGEYINDEFNPMYTLCPENINYNYFDYKTIYELIKDKKGSKYLNGNYYLFRLDDNLSVKVYYNDDKLLSKIIMGKDKNFSYELNFSFEQIIDVD